MYTTHHVQPCWHLTNLPNQDVSKDLRWAQETFSDRSHERQANRFYPTSTKKLSRPSVKGFYSPISSLHAFAELLDAGVRQACIILHSHDTLIATTIVILILSPTSTTAFL